MDSLVYSGLLEKADGLYIGSNGPNSGDTLKEFFSAHAFHSKIHFLECRQDIPNENETLNAMTRFARTCADSNILYIHTKGVTEKNELQAPWRNYMMRLVVSNYERCLTNLEFFSTIGALYLKRPYRHYSGNFFWARSSYIAKLDEITDINNRYSAERHILSKYSQTNHAAIGRSWYFLKIGPISITKNIFDTLDEFEYVI